MIGQMTYLEFTFLMFLFALGVYSLWRIQSLERKYERERQESRRTTEMMVEGFCGKQRPPRKVFCQLPIGHKGSHSAVIYWEDSS